jgi:hypothetical protein
MTTTTPTTDLHIDLLLALTGLLREAERVSQLRDRLYAAAAPTSAKTTPSRPQPTRMKRKGADRG